MFSYHNIIQPYRIVNDDLDKPNFIFSSDIPRKMRVIVDKYMAAVHDQIVDFGDGLEFCINIELNMLLSRNKHLKPSDLIKENLIYLANKKDRMPKSESRVFGRGVSAMSLSRFACHEIFIASLVLRVLDFRINRANNEICIDFLKDENYGILVLCDEDLIGQIECYMKNRFDCEISKNSTNVSAGLGEAGRDGGNADISSREFEFDEDDGLKSNMNTFIEEEDYNSSLEHLTLLKSNDTTRSTNDEDEELLKKAVSNSGHRNEENLKDVLNSKHNESQAYNRILENVPDSGSSNEIHIDDMNYEQHSDPSREFSDSLETVADLTKDNLERRLSDASFSSVLLRKRIQHKSSAASFSMINFEDSDDLDFAYKSKSESTPSYILQDKKFKFIKVGKVQKFVHLFEEKIGEEVAVSRPSTRAPSPIRKNTPPILK